MLSGLTRASETLAIEDNGLFDRLSRAGNEHCLGLDPAKGGFGSTSDAGNAPDPGREPTTNTAAFRVCYGNTGKRLIDRPA